MAAAALAAAAAGSAAARAGIPQKGDLLASALAEAQAKVRRLEAAHQKACWELRARTPTKLGTRPRRFGFA